MCCVIVSRAAEYDSASINLMRTQSKDLLRATHGLARKRDHPIFDKGWTTSMGQALPGTTFKSYHCQMAAGGFDQGFDLTYKGQLFEIAVSVQRGPGYGAEGRARAGGGLGAGCRLP